MKRCILAGVLLSSVALNVCAADMWINMFSGNLAEAEDGDVDAQYEVGIMYLKGQGVTADRGKAIEWLKTAAENGNEQASGKLSRMKGYEKEFQAKQKKAERGNANAQYDTGSMMLSGKGTKIDTQQAVDWLQKAADQGHEKAVTRLGIIYYKGDDVSANPARAVELFRKVASSQVLAQYYLGEAYSEGRGVGRDYQAAYDWYQKADNSGYKRAGGKMINIEEEIKMQERRAARVVREKQRAKERARLARLKAEEEKRQQKILAAQQASKQTARKASKQTAKKSQPKTRAAAARKKTLDVAYLAKKKWESRGKSVKFLPSGLNQCEQERNRLVCYSHNIKESTVGRNIKYRVKSIITPGKAAESFHVTYKNLVLDVVLHETDETATGYGDEQEQGFKVKTGWGKKHEADCKFDSATKVSCLKDGVHRLKIAIGKGGLGQETGNVVVKSR
jgi:TPR repeat protein